jgi:mannose-6-phosphate isomerase-like protein (cupin superfamily)
MTKIYTFDDTPHTFTENQGVLYRLVNEDVGSKQIGVLFVELEPHVSYPGIHYHKNRESVYMVLEGSATLLLDGKEHHIKARSVIYISPRAIHGIINTGDNGLKMVEVYSPLDPDFIKVEEQHS